MFGSKRSKTLRNNGIYLQTYTGVKFWALDPYPEEINIDDIAHALSMLCRYGGHCERFYSVAEHCVIMSNLVPERHAKWALLHDASEAYLVDMPRPIKRHMPEYTAIEERLQKVVAKKFGIPDEIPAEVHWFDHNIIFDEIEQNMKVKPDNWNDYASQKLVSVGAVLQYWSPEVAEREYRKRFDRLFIHT